MLSQTEQAAYDSLIDKLPTELEVNEDIGLRLINQRYINTVSAHYEVQFEGAKTGKMGLYHIFENSAWMFYRLDDNRGKGIATLAANRLVDVGFDDLDLDAIKLAIIKSNEKSQALATRLGAVIFSSSAGADVWKIDRAAREANVS